MALTFAGNTFKPNSWAAFSLAGTTVVQLDSRGYGLAIATGTGLARARVSAQGEGRSITNGSATATSVVSATAEGRAVARGVASVSSNLAAGNAITRGAADGRLIIRALTYGPSWGCLLLEDGSGTILLEDGTGCVAGEGDPYPVAVTRGYGQARGTRPAVGHGLAISSGTATGVGAVKAIGEGVTKTRGIGTAGTGAIGLGPAITSGFASGRLLLHVSGEGITVTNGYGIARDFSEAAIVGDVEVDLLQSYVVTIDMKESTVVELALLGDRWDS